MTNEEMLLRALNGETLAVTEFQPQNNKQAYLAYAVGLITDPTLLPEPRTNEEALLREYCLSGGGGGGGIVLPTLTNPASGLELLEGYDAIDENGNVIYGDMEDNSRKRMQAQVDLEEGTASVPRGFHDGITGVMLDIEEKTVTPSDTKQEIVPSSGAVLGKVIVNPAEGANFVITNAAYLFAHGARLDIKDTLMPLIKDCVSIASMFQSCSEITDPGIENLDTSKVTAANGCFSGCKAIERLDLSKWDMSKVTNLLSMFGTCSGLTSLNVKNWDTSSCTSMSSVFSGCSKLADLDISDWDVSSVTNMDYMFSNCQELKSMDFSKWDTSNVTSMGGMFSTCKSFVEIIGFSATCKAGMSIVFPFTTSGANYPLKRLTFRTDLPEGQYAIRSAIKLTGCSFTREGMVEMFNTLPDVSALGLNNSYKIITITNNPCVSNTTTLMEKLNVPVSGYAEFATLADEFYGPYDRTGAQIKGFVDGIGWETVNVTDVTEANFNYSQVSFVQFTATVPESEKLTTEDRAIATSKGWTLVT